MLSGPLPIPSLVSCNFIPVLSVSPTHCMALGRFLSSLNLYFPICVLEPRGQVIPRSPSGSDFPRLYLCQVQLPGFPASPPPPSALLCPVSGFLHWPDSPPGTTSPINHIWPFLQAFAARQESYCPSSPSICPGGTCLPWLPNDCGLSRQKSIGSRSI